MTKTGIRVSALGFGAMRLPVIDEDSANIDEVKAVEMIRKAIDGGVNYIDTAYPYHGGNSERVVAKALRDGYREKVHLASKLPTWLIEEASDFDRFLNEQLEKLETDSVEVYLLHSLNKSRWKKMKQLGALEWGKKAKADGRITHFGFSFHDDYSTFIDILESWDWDVCQIQYNYLDINKQAGKAGLERAAELGIDIVVMEPLYGGKLANLPDTVKQAWNGFSPDAARSNPVDIALRWIWDHKEAGTVLSGMSTMEQVDFNLECAGRSGVGKLRETEHGLVKAARKAYAELDAIPCTKCRYCLPCPSGVSIPENFEYYHLAKGFNDFLGRALYGAQENEVRASSCIGCRECEPKCPQNIIISEWMPKVDAFFSAP